MERKSVDLRDTGAYFVVRAGLISDHRLTGKELMTSAEASCQRELPVATIFVETPWEGGGERL